MSSRAETGASLGEETEASLTLEHMAEAAMGLARRGEALEDFATLVAHELKSPLEAALLAEDPRSQILAALDLVDSLLQAATEARGSSASLADCVAEAARRLHSIQLRVAVDESIRFPLPAKSLSVIIRNLLANAAAANAHRIEVFTTQRHGQWWLVVDDDGVGLETSDGGYNHGSGIGLELCRRIACRNGGWLELEPRRTGGTRAILTMGRAA